MSAFIRLFARPWLRTNGVNTNGAAAKVRTFDGLGKEVRLGTFGNIQVGKREYPQSPSVEQQKIRSDPMSADPMSLSDGSTIPD